MKKKFKHLVVVAATLSCFSAGAQSWSWAKDIPATGAIETKGIATDNYRNNYVVSNFAGTGTFGSSSLVSVGGSYDVALSKIDENGNYLWTVPVATGTGYDQGTAVICDPAGNDIYVTGQFYGTVTFGGTTVLTSYGNSDVFIAKFNASGAFVWATQAGGTGFDESYDIAWSRCSGICKGTYVFITGQFSGTATFGANVITSPVGSSMFTAFYNGGSAANVWVRQASTTYNSVYSSAIAVDASNNVYVTGKYYHNATFGSLTLFSNSYDQFVLKYNSAGTEQWVKQGGGTSTDEGRDLRVDASGNVYVAGEFASGTAAYGAYNLTGSGGSDIVVVKYNSSGAEQWATKAGGTWSDHVSGLALDATGCPLITGYFQSSVMSFGSITLNADAGHDPYVARLTAAGVFNKAVSPAGSPSYATGRPDDIAVSSLGHVFIAGDFQYSFIFGSTVINSGGPQHGFAAKLNPGDWPVVEGTNETVTNSDVDPAGNVYICGYTSAQNVFVKKINNGAVAQWTNYGFNGGFFCSVEAKAITCDASGNVYVAGRHNCTATFGSTTLPAGTTNAAFLVKYNSSGAQQWAVRAADGITGNVIVNDMTTDAAGNVYMTGEFYGNATFGNGGTTIALTGTNTNSDAFIAKFDPSGTLLMAVNACSGAGRDEATGIALSGSDIFLSGYFHGTNTPFGSGSVLGSASSTNSDMFIAKYNSAGVGQAVITGGSTLPDYMYDIASSAGNIYAVGGYAGTGVFGGVGIASSGSWDGILVKINPAAMTVSWVREVKNASSAFCRRVDATPSGVYITGEFYSSAVCGDGTTLVTLTSAGGDDIFVEKFDSYGTYQWVKQIGGGNQDVPTGLGVDGLEHAYLAGNFTASIVIDGNSYSSGTYFIEKFAFDDGTFARLAAEKNETEAPPAENVTVYPNPFSDYTVFDIPADYEGNYTLALYDVSGREAIRQSGTLGGQLILRKEGLAPGLYTYILFFDQETPATGKLVVE